MAHLSLIDIAGTPHEAGRALGRFGAAAVHEHLLHTRAWATVMAWRGSTAAAAMAALVRERFPGIWSELQGLAEGLHLPIEDVFLWNCRGDLWAMAPDGCTTVQLPGRARRRMVHNEDGDPGFAGRCALAACGIEGGPRFVSFVYPGSLPGHTFAVTDGGLAMAVNNLRVLHVAAGVPRMVLTRAVLAATTLDAAVSLLREQPRAGGFHLTLGHRDSADLLSIEFSALACSVRTVTAPSLHANHAIHPPTRDLPQRITGSSGHRQVRGDALLDEARAQGVPVDPLAILADTGNAQFPILRLDPADGDDENTLATADIVIEASHIDWRVHEHPRGPARYVFTDGHVQEGARRTGAG
ncbi:MAG: peptidase C45 [Proteobacteria bacterium]|nr:peptidase C45 [Pseudomonadota bacterium]